MRVPVLLVLGTCAALSACASKEEPAKQAVASAEAALNEVKPNAEKLAPDQLQVAEKDLDALKDKLSRKKYQDVLEGVPKLNEEVKTLQESIVAKQTQVAAATHEWEDLREEVPKLVAAIENQVANTSKSKLPQDVKTTVETMKSTWDEAEAAFNAGNATEAADKGRAVQAKAREVSEKLGISAA